MSDGEASRPQPSYPPIQSAHLRKLFLDARLRWEAEPAAVGVEADLEAAWAKLEDSLEEHPNLRRQVLGDAAGPTAGDEQDAGPLPVLPAVREAVRLMEAVYFRLRLGGQPGSAAHRRSLPWLNRFGRWTGAQLFRRWWPWLVPLHDADFVRFAEIDLGLPPLARRFGTARLLHAEKDRDAYALRRWRDELGRDPAAADVFGFFMDFGEPWGETNAAVAVVECLEREGDRVARWYAEDLYVPPGLWGIGIGEAFLQKLLELLAEHGCRSARVESPPRGAHWHTLYATAAFVRKTEADDGGGRRTYYERALPVEPPEPSPPSRPPSEPRHDRGEG